MDRLDIFAYRVLYFATVRPPVRYHRAEAQLYLGCVPVPRRDMLVRLCAINA